MLRLIIQQFKKIFNDKKQPASTSASENISVDSLIQTLLTNNDNSAIPTTLNNEETQAVLDNACATINLYIREDGEFAITSNFTDTSDEVIEVSSLILHMMNSGQLVDYFLKSLKLWGKSTNNEEFILDIIKQWKVLYEQVESHNDGINSKLAVDPSEVFSLKHLIAEDR